MLILIKENHEPIICGGAGLYYRALHEGIFEDSISDSKIREKLENEYDNNPQILLDRSKKVLTLNMQKLYISIIKNV